MEFKSLKLFHAKNTRFTVLDGASVSDSLQYQRTEGNDIDVFDHCKMGIICMLFGFLDIMYKYKSNINQIIGLLKFSKFNSPFYMLINYVLSNI